MPIDRSNQNTPRPLKPTLASNRTAKTPLTPRLAASSTATSASSTLSTRTTRTSNGTTPRANGAAAETTTPAKPYLSNNITPRSSTRKSRVGVDSLSPNSTPGGTPTNSRPASTTEHHRDQGPSYSHGTTGANGAQGGLRPRGAAASGVSQTTPTPRLPLAGAYRQAPSETGMAKDVSSLFFRADDVKPHEQKKGPVFFHANGKADEPSRPKNGPSPPLSSLGRNSTESKFFHADSLQEPRERAPASSPPVLAASPELLPPHNAGAGNSLRPASPTKDWAHLSYRKGASQVMRPALNARNSALSMLSGQSTADVPDSARRKSSASQSAVKFSHAKSASLSSIDSVSDLKKGPSAEHPAMTPSPLHTENRLVIESSMRDSIASIASAPSPPLAALSGLPSPVPMSPTAGVSGKSALEAMNELAANARRERKVLDLEISNSSLLAINRSLEKEVRKQKAELRRFRRLSRAGRFSTDIGGSSPPETYSSIRASHRGDLSDMSEEDEDFTEEIEEPEELEDSEESPDEGTLSPTLQAERDEAHRLRDEKRLELDLSKHRELLIDSQKMNQSLKKCLGWTEQLIKDGQKALEYKVNVSDVKLGGRVLISDDHDERDDDDDDEDDDDDDAPPEESRGLLSPWSPIHTAMDALDSPFFAEVNRLVDRDSGIDMDALEAIQHASGVPLPQSPTSAPSVKSPDKEFRPRVPGRWESFATTSTTRPQSRVLDDLPPLGSPFEEKLRDLHASIDAFEAAK